MTLLSPSRRGLLLGGAVTALSSQALANSGTPAQLFDLMTDGLVTPLGLETSRPRLSWKLKAARRGAAQRSYRVRVASTQALLTDGHADLWDSGEVVSAMSFDIAYDGKPLTSRQRCWWQVAVKDDAGATLTSPMSWWEMGLLSPADWQAQWLAAEAPILAADRATGMNWIWNADAPASDASQAFRFHFHIPAKPVAATLLIIARDFLDGVWINGASVERHPFKPSTVNSARMESLDLDVAAGDNVLAVQAHLRPDAWPKTEGGGLAAVLRLTFADGTVTRLVSGADWRATSAPADGWQAPAFADTAWSHAVSSASRPNCDPWISGPAMWLRRPFALNGDIASARLYITALGAYEAWLNGQRVGDGLLAPESSDFSKRVLYRVHDVTALVKSGPNVLGCLVGDGWYGSTGLFGGRFPWGPAPNRLLAQLEITTADGRRHVIASGDGWQTAPSPVIASEIYDGEIYDARQEKPGWSTAAFDAAAWAPAVSAPKPPCALIAATSPPVRIYARLKLVSITAVGNAWVVDFGQNFAGRCRLSAKAPAGTRVTLRFAEILKTDGTADQSNLRSAEARDIYIFRGDPAGESFAPHFTYHGFRYVEVTGWPGALTPDMIIGEAISSDLEQTGRLRIADPLIDRIWRNTLWSQRSNFLGIPTDCPQRDERLGWMGDAQIFWDAAAFNMNVDAFTRRFAGEMRDGQAANGAFPEFTPQPVDAMGMKGAPGWADAGILLPWTAWWRYGDTAIIDEHWGAMVKYADHVHAENPDFIWRNARGSDFGDWLALDAKEPGDPTTPKDLIATAFWAHSCACLADMAEASGRAEAAVTYRRRRDAITSAFAKAFVGADGTVGNGSQTGYILALKFELIAPALRQAATVKLVADIRRRGVILSTGFLGTPLALDVLADGGETDLVYQLLARTEYPSWGYMIVKGATTSWERWNSDVGDVAMNSFNHYALGAVVGFFYRRIAGIDAQAPGFRKIRIDPAPGKALRQGGGSYDSVMGPIVTDWRRDDGRFSLDVTVPGNATASVHLPAGRCREGGKDISGRRDIRLLTRDTRETVLEIGAGQYRFVVT